jgi:hypothetical protein
MALKKQDLQIKDKENILKVNSKVLEAKTDGTNETNNFSTKFNMLNVCQTNEKHSLKKKNL